MKTKEERLDEIRVAVERAITTEFELGDLRYDDNSLGRIMGAVEMQLEEEIMTEFNEILSEILGRPLK